MDHPGSDVGREKEVVELEHAPERYEDDDGPYRTRGREPIEPRRNLRGRGNIHPMNPGMRLASGLLAKRFARRTAALKYEATSATAMLRRKKSAQTNSTNAASVLRKPPASRTKPASDR